MDRTLIKKYIDNQPQKVVGEKMDLGKNKIEYQGTTPRSSYQGD